MLQSKKKDIRLKRKRILTRMEAKNDRTRVAVDLKSVIR